MATKVKLYQIYYSDQTKKMLNPICIPYDNEWYEGKEYQPFFENHVIVDLISQGANNDCEYFGVFSWQFEHKNPYNLENLEKDIIRFPNQDIYSFYKLHTQPNVWRVAENWHKGIIDIAQYIFNKYNQRINIRRLNTPTIYQNAFIARKNVYDDYVNNFLKPLMEIMQDPDDSFLQEKLYQDTKYKSGRFSPNILKNITGVPYYPMHTFICERFFSTYLTTKYYSLKHLC